MKNIIVTFILTGCIATYAAAETPAAVNIDNDSSSGVNIFALAAGSPDQANQKEDEAYNSAKEALDDGDYPEAVKGFGEVAKMKGRRADAAMYWRAYALN